MQHSQRALRKTQAKKLRILIVTHHFQPHVGGIEIVAFNQAKELVRRGHDVTIVTSKIGDEPEQEVIDGIKVRRVRAWNILERRLGVPYPLFSPRLSGTLREEIGRADSIIAHSHTFMPSTLAAHYARKMKKTLLVIQHNTFIEYRNPLLRVVQHIADKTLGHYTLTRATKRIAVSEESARYVRSITRRKDCIVLYNGVDVKRFRPKDKTKTREKLGLPRGTICFCVRRITWKNGIDTLLKAAQLLKDQDITFVIGGKGADLPAAKEYARKQGLDRVRFVGFISDAQLPDYYAAADLFLLPSKKGEGFPLVILEALAAGTPVVATRSGGHIELIDDNIGRLISPESPEEMVAAIKELQRTNLRTMSKACRALVEQKLSWERNVNDLVVLLEGPHAD